MPIIAEHPTMQSHHTQSYAISFYQITKNGAYVEYGFRCYSILYISKEYFHVFFSSLLFIFSSSSFAWQLQVVAGS